MSLGNSLLTLLTLLLGGALALGAAPALAAPADPADRAGDPGLTLTAPSRYAGQPAPVTITLTDEAGEPVAGATIRLERRTGGVWTDLATLTTDESGVAVTQVELSREPADNVLRATRVDSSADPDAGPGADPGAEPGTNPTTGPVTLPLRRRNAEVTLKGPDAVVDETSIRVSVRWRTGAGAPVAGELVLERRLGGRWKTETRLRTDDRGRAATRVAPREDARYRVRTPRRPWLERGTSRVHRVDNTPPGTVVRLGGPAPRRTLPRPARAVGGGPAARITPIPGKVWASMTGRTWHRGCPVGRDGLRLLRINYWGYDGYRYRGELVAAASVIGQIAGALSEMYRRELPIRAMYRADRFGWSARLKGADDYASMAAGNTSAFNCRQVVGRTGIRSPHAWGRSLDVNTWENPYRSSHGLVPNSWWASRAHPRVAWRSSGHRVVSIMRAHGLRWTYGTADAHHFDAVPHSGKRAAARSTAGHEHTPSPVLPKRCARVVCD